MDRHTDRFLNPDGRAPEDCQCEYMAGDCGHAHHTECYCNEDQGSGYTFDDEYGPCAFCEGSFSTGQRIGANRSNVLVVCGFL